MADPEASAPEAPPPSEWGTKGVDAYIEASFDKFTPEALTAALLAAGHDAAAIAAALERAAARQVSAPVRNRARTVIRAAYALTYLVLLVGLLAGPSMYGLGFVAAIILTVLLGFAFVIAAWWVGRGDAPLGFAGLLSVPVILLVVVGGACMFTTGTPFNLFLNAAP